MTQHWPTLMGDMQHRGYRADAFKPPLELAWKSYVHKGNWGSAIIVGPRAFIASDELYAFDLVTGDKLWQTTLDIASRGPIAPTAWRDLVLIGGRTGLYAISQQDGSLLWHYPSEIISSTINIVNDCAYWSAEGQQNALDLETIQLIWQQPRHAVYFSPTVFANRVYSFDGTSESNTLYVDDAQSGTPLWNIPLPLTAGDPVTHVCIDGSTLFVTMKRAGALGNGLMALDALTGALQWQFSSAYLSTPPCVTHDTIYVAGLGMFALDRTTGALRWAREYPLEPRRGYIFERSAPICIGDTIYIGGGTFPFITSFDALQGGAPTWFYTLNAKTFSTPSYANRHLLIGAHDGYLYCFRQAQSG